MGPCADYPDGAYMFGEIGIGSCISSPSDLLFLGEGAGSVLAVSNTNAFGDFVSGSVLLVDWSSLDLDADTNRVSDLSTRVVEDITFTGQMALLPERDLLVVPERSSADARTRAWFDSAWFLDVSDPMSAALADVTVDGGGRLEVESDPFPTAWDAAGSRLFVGNRTSHTISVADGAAQSISLVDALPDAQVGFPRWFDADQSGSHAEFTTLEAATGEDVTILDETFSLSWVDGTLRLWAPKDGGLARASSGGDGAWTWSAYGRELAPEDSGGLFSGVSDPSYNENQLRMFFSDGDSIMAAAAIDYSADWAVEVEPLLVGEEGTWSQILGGPTALQDEGLTWLFFDARALQGEPVIGAATSTDGYTGFQPVVEGALFTAGGAHDQVGQADPNVAWDSFADRWRMYYGAWDGQRWTIGQAWSDDLESWTADPAPVLDLAGAQAAAPEVEWYNGRFHMFFSYRAPGSLRWQVGEATSVDGTTWAFLGPVLDLSDELLPPLYDAEPPGVTLQSEPATSFRIEGSSSGLLTYDVAAGTAVESTAHGFKVRVSVGQLADLGSVGDLAVEGMSVSSMDPVSGLVFFDMEDEDNTRRIGVGTWDGERLVLDPTPVLEPSESGFDQSGVGYPVVLSTGSGWVMYYAGFDSGVVQIGRATSPDGLTWTRSQDTPVLANGTDWDSVQMYPGSAEVLEDGSIRLWYAGTDGARYAIGAATTTDGVTFTRVEGDDGYLFGPGSPGEWDDSGVRTPYVLTEGDTVHLWYTGYDGNETGIGYAWADASLQFTRATGYDGEPRQLLSPTANLFDNGGVERPVVLAGDGGYTVFYRGDDATVYRPGLAWGTSPDVLYKAPSMPTVGDWLQFTTMAGEEGVNPIRMDQVVDGVQLSGIGLTALAMDDERGFLYVTSKLQQYLTVLDVRDDSTVGFHDDNAMGVEAVITWPVSSGTEWLRSIQVVPGSSYLYVLSASPDTVNLLDLSQVVDDGEADVIRDAHVGWLTTARGNEHDYGEDTEARMGPSGLALHPDGHTLYVANFNENSLAAYDLRMAGYGALVSQTPFLCENPSVVRLSPDGRYGAVGCYVGQVEDGRVDSEVVIVDADPTSPRWMEVLTRVVNR